jgi:hypothetical protein
MGKATNPAKARQRATAEQQAKGGISQHNGVQTNNATSPVVLWRSKKMLDDTHEAAIAYCNRIWDLLANEPRITANYGECVGPSSSEGESEGMILKRLDAREDLKRIEGYIPEKYWRIFVNCVRFDEPTGYLGSKLHGGTKTTRTRAHVTVCFVADVICMREGLI